MVLSTIWLDLSRWSRKVTNPTSTIWSCTSVMWTTKHKAQSGLRGMLTHRSVSNRGLQLKKVGQPRTVFNRFWSKDNWSTKDFSCGLNLELHSGLEPQKCIKFVELQIRSKKKFLSVLYYMGVKYAKIVLGTGRDGQFAQIIVKFGKKMTNPTGPGTFFKRFFTHQYNYKRIFYSD